MKPYHGGAKEDASMRRRSTVWMGAWSAALLRRWRKNATLRASIKARAAPHGEDAARTADSPDPGGGQLEDGMAVWKNVLEEQKKLCEPIEQLLSILLTMKEAQKQSDRKRLIRLGKKHFKVMRLV
jgi:hypothetical protein